MGYMYIPIGKLIKVRHSLEHAQFNKYNQERSIVGMLWGIHSQGMKHMFEGLTWGIETLEACPISVLECHTGSFRCANKENMRILFQGCVVLM